MLQEIVYCVGRQTGILKNIEPYSNYKAALLCVYE